MAPDGNMLVNTLYHSALVSGIAIGYSRLGKILVGGAPTKLDLTPRDARMLIARVALAMATKDTVIKQLIIPVDIMK